MEEKKSIVLIGSIGGAIGGALGAVSGSSSWVVVAVVSGLFGAIASWSIAGFFKK